MDEYADIYYVDGNRNALVRRSPVIRGPLSGATMTRPPYLPAPSTAMQPVVQPAAQAAPVYYSNPPQVVYANPPQPQPTANTVVSSLLGRVTAGQLIDMVAQVFAVLQALPAPPTVDDDTHTNVSNLILYQSALAQHAKRDEQVRTLGTLVSRLVG
jgi:hypothetical protein